MLENGGDENRVADVVRLMWDLQRISAETGASVIFSHHFAKGDSSEKEVIDRGAGSCGFNRYPDAFMTLTPPPRGSVYHSDFHSERLMCAEFVCRSFKQQAARVVKWDFPTWIPTSIQPAEFYEKKRKK